MLKALCLSAPLLLSACGGGGSTGSSVAGDNLPANLAPYLASNSIARPDRLEFRVVNTSGVVCAALPQDVTVAYDAPKNGRFILFDDYKDGKELCYLALSENNPKETLTITVKNPDGTDFPGSGLVEVDASESYLTPDPPAPPLVTNSAPTASGVSISDGNGGDAVVGDTLTGNYTYSDADNDAEGASTYRWLRDGGAIVGATGRTYMLVAADAGHGITFEVTPVAAAGAGPGAAVASSAVNAVSAVVQPSPTGKLNDTGITADQCGNASANAACPQAGFPQQDGETGRDATQPTNNDADGHRGFSFTKISSTGMALAADAASWACVKDNVTGLIWEVKTDDDGLHDKDWTYTWYDPNTVTNGGDNGVANGGSCGDTSACDTSSYVVAVNAEGWCGATSGWRMPTVGELQSIADLSGNGLAIDVAYFPNTVLWLYWSGTPYAGDASSAWYVFFGYGSDGLIGRDLGVSVRLVRSGQ
ncbi:DUF1566 domain-containing protein [Candidatus Thiothrix sp. Deng01]|uniref:DUF1566 domain-containing protein n=1 Tax=Candidatus Thiothrix phosphatis TaxID=3112415 RepID=A0ABU6CVY7_9GAMM|nr:DUF1566 domain-containing protein [Candidatus Thiothrix sp. Deng01]MEB4590558.1 DUF1566 domain-containing protein [Candidatus Thiothrix sp. Deng01]